MYEAIFSYLTLSNALLISSSEMISTPLWMQQYALSFVMFSRSAPLMPLVFCAMYSITSVVMLCFFYLKYKYEINSILWKCNSNKF